MAGGFCLHGLKTGPQLLGGNASAATLFEVGAGCRQQRGTGGNHPYTTIAYLGRSYINLAFGQCYQNRIDDTQLAEYLDIKRPNREAVIWIDDRRLSQENFGRLPCTYAGWGMRVVFVPDDELDREPWIEIRDPSD